MNPSFGQILSYSMHVVSFVGLLVFRFKNKLLSLLFLLLLFFLFGLSFLLL